MAEIHNDTAFVELREEIAKIDRLGGPQQPVNWDRVIALSSALLEKSSDPLVAAYRCYGLFRKESYKGLARGLPRLREVASELLLNTGTRQERKTKGAFEWLADKIDKAAIRKPPDVSEQSHAADCIGIAEAIERDFGPQAFVLKHLRLPKQEDTSHPEIIAGAVQDNGHSPQSPSASDGADEVVKRAWKTVLGAALEAHTTDRAAVWPYKVARLASWMDLLSYPENKNRKTRIPKPPRSVAGRLSELEQNAEWTELLDDAELQFRETPLWLDLQRLSFIALSALGPEHSEAAEVVRTETAVFLNRLPDLLFYTFSDGTDFASPNTREWAKGITVPTPAINKGQPDTPTEDPLINAESLLRRTTFSKSAESFGKLLLELKAGRDRFRMRMIFADICSKERHFDMAMAQYRILDTEAEVHGLAEWEPALCAEFLSAWWLFIADGGAAPNLAPVADTIYTRLSKIDTVTALNLSKPPKR